MEKYTGRSLLKGIAIGKIFFCSRKKTEVKKDTVTDIRAELERFEKAKKKASSEFQQLYQKACREAGPQEAAIFQVYEMILEDGEFQDTVCHMIRSEKRNAEYAAEKAGEQLAQRFASMEDEYFQARSEDMREIAQSVVRILTGSEDARKMPEEPVILAAENLTPGETVQMDLSRVLGMVTQSGSSYSHTAILARSKNIPALLGISVSGEMNGKFAILDGIRGELLVDPDPETLETYREKQKREMEEKERLSRWKGQEDVTLDGRHIRLYANVGGADDIQKVLENDAAGIGLFRSEFLYMGKEDYPSEEEQYLTYKTVLEAMKGKQVIIRTLDLGSDKQAAYLPLEREENPAMGYRGIRICLDKIEIFKTQLRALLRASVYGNLGILYPMIISVEEVRKIKHIVREVQKELDAKAVPYGQFQQGVMIETPAAVMISDLLAKEVDFFSIGTNDLTQYTLAADRQNAKLEKIYDGHHPAILRMIRMTVENGHKEHCPVGICGELAADLSLTETFLKMGIDELSVSPAYVLPVREKIRSVYAGTGQSIVKSM